MTDEPAAQEPEEELPALVIEGARSARARCKLCRQKIDKDVLRIGTLVEGPYGTGYIWEHLRCAARRSLDKVEEAYAARAWENAKVPPEDVPAIEELRKLGEEADKKRAEKRTLPYAELAPSGRSRCKHSGDPIAQGGPRVVLARQVAFGNQTRSSPINVLPEHVAEALRAEDCGTEAEGFADALRANSRGLDASQLDAILADIGPLE